MAKYVVLTIRFTPENEYLYDWLRNQAEETDRSLNKFAINLIREARKRHNKRRVK